MGKTSLPSGVPIPNYISDCTQQKKKVKQKMDCTNGFVYILTIKSNELHYFSTLFGKELYMFRTDLLSIIRSLDTVFTAIVICHTSYVVGRVA